MRLKGKVLELYELNYSWNDKKIIPYNIFGSDYIEKLYKEFKKKNIKSKNDLKEFTLLYLRKYWSRCEYEIAVGGLHSKYPEEFEKIDVFKQVEMNIDRITEYVIQELKMNI